MKRALLIALALTLAASAPVLAQGRPSSRPDHPQWSLGLGVISSPEPYVGTDNEVMVIPVVGLRYKRFTIQGVRAGFEVFERGGLRVGAGAAVRFMGYEADDSPFLEGMDDRDFSVDAVVLAEWTRGSWSVEGALRRDLLGRSDGLETELRVGRSFGLLGGRLRLQPALGAVWQDDRMVDYYYGVRADEATPFRPAFDGSSSSSGSATLFAFYRLGPRWQLTSFVRYEVLGSEITASPIVDRDAAVTGLLALSWEL